MTEKPKKKDKISEALLVVTGLIVYYGSGIIDIIKERWKAKK